MNDRFDAAAIEEGVRMILRGIGEDPERGGLRETPARVARMYGEIFAGIDVDASQIVTLVEGADFDEMIMVRDIPLYSMCEHHLIPFNGKAHVAYIPNGKIVGLSKLPRIVEVFARRLQVQERLTDQVADAIMDTLHPMGVGVVIDCLHLCMAMRGVEKQNSRTMTSALRGVFRDDPRTRDEFLRLVSPTRTYG